MAAFVNTRPCTVCGKKRGPGTNHGKCMEKLAANPPAREKRRFGKSVARARLYADDTMFRLFQKVGIV